MLEAIRGITKFIRFIIDEHRKASTKSYQITHTMTKLRPY